MDFWLIVPPICTYKYDLAQYLGSYISPHIPSKYSPKDNFTFIEEIKWVSVTEKLLISLNEMRLITNTPFVI